MDFIKGAMGSGSNNQNTATSNTSTGTQGGQQNQDYVDKAFDMASKKSGHDFAPSTDEKITDAGRSAYEKMTGKKVNSKISN